MVTCIKTGDIVAVHGQFPCGAWPDLKFFKRKLKNLLRPANEKVEVDRGYQGEKKVQLPDEWVTLSNKKAKASAGARHETINGHLKRCRCLSKKLCHELSKHKDFFSLAAAVTQLMFEYHRTTFEVRY